MLHPPAGFEWALDVNALRAAAPANATAAVSAALADVVVGRRYLDRYTRVLRVEANVWNPQVR